MRSTTKASKQSRRRNCRLRAALGLAKRGFSVFPCRPNSKQPATKHGVLDATTNRDTIRAWWKRWPRSNIAVATGGDQRLLVIDVDPGGAAAWCELENEHGLITTVEVATPRGRHFWFQIPANRSTPGNSAGRLAPGIDTRGEGGYALAPPSVVLGRPYRWAGGGAITSAPAWLLDRLNRPGGNGPAATPEEWLALATGGVDEGARNAAVASIAGLLFRYMPATHAEMTAELVACWNEQRCRPPLDARELRRILDSIANAEGRRRGFWS